MGILRKSLLIALSIAVVIVWSAVFGIVSRDSSHRTTYMIKDHANAHLLAVRYQKQTPSSFFLVSEEKSKTSETRVDDKDFTEEAMAADGEGGTVSIDILLEKLDIQDKDN